MREDLLKKIIHQFLLWMKIYKTFQQKNICSKYFSIKRINSFFEASDIFQSPYAKKLYRKIMELVKISIIGFQTTLGKFDKISSRLNSIILVQIREFISLCISSSVRSSQNNFL